MTGRRGLQLAFLVTAMGLVVVGDLVADRLAILDRSSAAVPFVAVGARVLGGFAVGLALRLQFSRRSRPDPGLRMTVALPCALLAAVPGLLAMWPWSVPLPAEALLAAHRLAPFAGAALGATLALSVGGQGGSAERR